MDLSCIESTRFWAKVDKRGPVCKHLGTRCWLWTARRSKAAYGEICIKGVKQLAHRISWRLTKRRVLSREQKILHRCDNPPCVRPSHLFKGTQARNILDMITKGRDRKAMGAHHGSKTHPECLPRGIRNGRYTHPETTARGEKHGGVKLGEADILVIRMLSARGYSSRVLAARFAVTRQNIRRIVRRLTWAFL